MRIAWLILGSVGAGVVAHVLFYPLIMGWHNERMKLLARPAVGVLWTLPVFVAWQWRLLPVADDRERATLISVGAFMSAFSTVGAGVGLGYVVDDLLAQRKARG
jgi:hypothetical protein